MNTQEHTHYDIFLEKGIILLQPYTKSKDKHKVKCVCCSYEWETTPHSISQSYSKYGSNGCPECKKNKLYGSSREMVLLSLKKRGLTVLTPNYNGNQDSQSKIWVRNEHCGHEFEISPNNLIVAGVDCSICGKQWRNHLENV